MPLPISVVVITYNEEDNIGRCLESVAGWVDEIVVVDSFSTDRTVEIAESYHARVIRHEFQGYMQQKNVALDAARNDWVLSLDADETVSPELADAIRRRWPAEKETFNGFVMNRRSQFLGYWMTRCGWYPDRKLRLFRRSAARWEGGNPHERVALDGETAHLDGDIHHFTYRNMDDWLRRMDHYAAMAAREQLETKPAVTLIDIAGRPAWKFFRCYVLKRGILAGMHGLVLSVGAAFYVFLKYARLWELQERRSVQKTEHAHSRRDAA